MGGGGVSQHYFGHSHTPSGGHAPRQTPPPPRVLPDTVNKRVVCILLECIPVWHNFCQKLLENEKKNWTKTGTRSSCPQSQWRIYIVKFWTLASPRDPNSFNFMHFLGKFGKIVRWHPPESWRPLLGEILDPPLDCMYSAFLKGIFR